MNTYNYTGIYTKYNYTYMSTIVENVEEDVGNDFLNYK